MGDEIALWTGIDYRNLFTGYAKGMQHLGQLDFLAGVGAIEHPDQSQTRAPLLKAVFLLGRSQ